MTALAKYLARYAEAESGLVDSLATTNFDHVLVIPAHRESANVVARIWQGFSGRILVILVVNTGSADDNETPGLLETMTDACTDRVDNLYLTDRGAGHAGLLVVDRCTPGRLVPPRQGVGLARKIGADIALKLMDRGVVGAPFIHCTDADVELPPDYFEWVPGESDIAAWLYPFHHLAEPDLALASTLYEISMLYYVAGLRWAGSPYAFTTVGSTMAVHKDHYAAVRGFPRRNAAEDFYLLNKLAKTGVLRQAKEPFIRIRARHSDRAPFGTGASLARIAGLDDPRAAFRFYHPEIFRHLRVWQHALMSLSPGEPLVTGSRELDQWREASGFAALLADRGGQFKRRAAFIQFLHEWFDSFRTLKFIHFMRDQFFPSVTLEQIADLEFTPPINSVWNFRDELATRCFDGQNYGVRTLREP